MRKRHPAEWTVRLIATLCVLPLSGVAARQQTGGAQQGLAQAVVFEGTAAISGVVTDATTGQPITGVMVYLGYQGRGAVGRLSRQISDERGRFVFSDLPAGNLFFINASKPGYVDGHYGVGAGGQLGGLITVTDGQWFSDARIVMSRLAAINGMITDERGEPAVGVFVRVLSRIQVAGNPRLASGQTARTDDRGVYRLPDLIPGRYVVQVPNVNQTFAPSLSAAEVAGLAPDAASKGRTIPEPPASMEVPGGARLVLGGYLTPPAPINGRPQAYPPLFYPGTAVLASASTIELHAGEERSGINMVLTPTPATTVSGVVEGPPDTLAGTFVRLIPEGFEELGSGGESATATLGSDGRFTFSNVPAGPYLIDIRRGIAELLYRQPLTTMSAALPASPGLTGGGAGGIQAGPRGATYSLRGTRGSSAYFAQHRLNVDARPLTNVIVKLQKGGTIRGKFVVEGDAPQGQSPTSTVYAEPADGNLAYGMWPSSSPAPLTFEIPGIPPGRFLLRFLTVPGGGVVKSVMRGDGLDHRVRPFEISPGQDVDVVVTVTTKRIDLTGTARDAKGAQIENAIVLAFPTDRTLWTNYGLTPAMLKGSPTSSSGSYRFQSLPAGEYYLVGVPPEQGDAWQDPARLQRLAAQAVRVTLDWGDVKVQNVPIVRLQ